MLHIHREGHVKFVRRPSKYMRRMQLQASQKWSVAVSDGTRCPFTVALRIDVPCVAQCLHYKVRRTFSV